MSLCHSQFDINIGEGICLSREVNITNWFRMLLSHIDQISLTLFIRSTSAFLLKSNLTMKPWPFMEAMRRAVSPSWMGKKGSVICYVTCCHVLWYRVMQYNNNCSEVRCPLCSEYCSFSRGMTHNSGLVHIGSSLQKQFRDRTVTVLNSDEKSCCTELMIS